MICIDVAEDGTIMVGIMGHDGDDGDQMQPAASPTEAIRMATSLLEQMIGATDDQAVGREFSAGAGEYGNDMGQGGKMRKMRGMM